MEVVFPADLRETPVAPRHSPHHQVIVSPMWWTQGYTGRQA